MATIASLWGKNMVSLLWGKAPVMCIIKSERSKSYIMMTVWHPVRVLCWHTDVSLTNNNCGTHTHTHTQKQHSCTWDALTCYSVTCDHFTHTHTHTHTHTQRNSIPVREMHSPVTMSPVTTLHTQRCAHLRTHTKQSVVSLIYLIFMNVWRLGAFVAL